MKEFKQLSSPIFVSKRDTTSAGAVTQCKTGASLGSPLYKNGDVCLAAKGKVASKVFINSTVLKSAILNSPEFFKKELGLVFSEVGTEVAVEEPVAKQPEVEIIEPAIVSSENKFDLMTVAELKKEADKLELEYAGNIRKADLLDLINGATE